MAKKKTAKKTPVKRKASPKKSRRQLIGQTAQTVSVGSIHRKAKRMLPVPREFANLVLALERELGRPVWMLIQPLEEEDLTDRLSDELADLFIANQQDLPNDQKVALLLNSPGGQARPAFRIARLLDKRCGGFVVVIPRIAKSAATLLALGADEIILGEDAELGPLDAQIKDPEREERLSALDETQAVDALENAGIDIATALLHILQFHTPKKRQTLMPHVLHFAADILKPLFDKIDAVRFSQMSRILKDGEQYARRLLAKNYEKSEARVIASKLVTEYFEHGFFIDRKEAREEIGLRLPEPSSAIAGILRNMYPFLASFAADTPEGVNVLGRLKEVSIT